MRTRHRPLSLILLLTLLVPLACGDDDDDTAATTDESTATTRERRGSDTTRPRRERAARENGVVFLSGEGLAVGAEGEETSALAFGSPRDEVLPEIRRIFGRPAERGEHEDCPAGTITFARFGDDGVGLLVNLQDGTFVGWSIDGTSKLQTADGIGIGSTKAAFEERYGPVQMVPDSTIGVEFYIEGSFSGLLDADAPDGTITNLWAGIACIFR